MIDRRIPLSDVQKDTFRTLSERRGDSIVVHLKGNADIDAQEHLKKFLDELHQQAMQLGIRTAVFELEELYFMNSSCLSLLLRHVNAVMATPSSKAYRLVFRPNGNLRWQKRSLQALGSYAPDIVSVE